MSVPEQGSEPVRKRYCQICGNKLGRNSRSFKHSAWPEGQVLWVCESCVEHGTLCQVCSIPLRDSDTSDVCATCSQSMPRCLACGDVISGHYVQFGGQGPYCEKCASERERCDVCGSPLDHSHQILSDGRHICTACHNTAIYGQDQAQQVYEQVRQIILNELALSLNVPTGLILVGRDQLSQVFSEMGYPTGDLTQTLGVYTRQGRKRGIYVQSGLPRHLLMQVIAHEWAHAWQMENAPLLKDPVVKEGFAEWVAYKVLNTIGAKAAKEQMMRRQDAYGVGLQRAIAVEDVSGKRGVLNWCCGAG